MRGTGPQPVEPGPTSPLDGSTEVSRAKIMEVAAWVRSLGGSSSTRRRAPSVPSPRASNGADSTRCRSRTRRWARTRSRAQTTSAQGPQPHEGGGAAARSVSIFPDQSPRVRREEISNARRAVGGRALPAFSFKASESDRATRLHRRRPRRSRHHLRAPAAVAAAVDRGTTVDHDGRVDPLAGMSMLPETRAARSTSGSAGRRRRNCRTSRRLSDGWLTSFATPEQCSGICAPVIEQTAQVEPEHEIDAERFQRDSIYTHDDLTDEN